MKKLMFSGVGILVVFNLLFLSCATAKMSSVEKVELERQNRAYDRYVREHEVNDKDDLDKTGIHHYKNAFYVVISLTDSGIDNYADWAGNKLVSSMMSYNIFDVANMTQEEYAAFILKFKVISERDTGFTNIVQVRIRERDIKSFREQLL